MKEKEDSQEWEESQQRGVGDGGRTNKQSLCYPRAFYKTSVESRQRLRSFLLGLGNSLGLSWTKLWNPQYSEHIPPV